MDERRIKVIKGTSTELSIEQLERASGQLLLARIRGHEPQVSFMFIQRMLDELIRRRRAEVQSWAPFELLLDESEPELLGSADILSDDTEEVFDFDELGLSDLDLEGLEDFEDEDEDKDEDEEPLALQQPPKRSRPSVLACSKHSSRSVWAGEVNLLRALVLSLLAFFVMACVVMLAGCGS